MNANEITFGVEIETTIPYGAIRVGPHGRGYPIAQLRGQWLADRDPSIAADAGREGCEFVSPIFKGAAGLKQLIADIATIKAMGATVNASCGLHIHVGFDRANTAATERLVTLVANFEKAIFASTGTKSRETGRWCNGVQRYGQASAAIQGASYNRYHVLNLATNKPTVEFRAFAGTLNASKIIAHVRTCVGLVERAYAAKRVTTWTAKTPVASSPIARSGEGQTHLTRLYYQLGWTKGRESRTFGMVGDESTPDIKASKKILMKLARKYDGRGA